MAGPATNMATLAVIKKAIGTKFMWIYLSSIVIGALFFGFLINLVIPHDFLIPYVSKASEHSMSGTILTTILGVILLGLIFYALFLDRYFNKKEVIIMKNTLKVEGMMCNHCKNNVETNVSKQEGVTQTQVNLETKEVQIEGNVDIQHIKKVINNLGYKVIEK